MGSTCHNNATCTNTIGSYQCNCNAGHSGNGTHCDGKLQKKKVCMCDDVKDVIKNYFRSLSMKTFSLRQGRVKSVCFYVMNSLILSFLLVDINECTSSPCDPNAHCINAGGSYSCSCLPGYTGNGTHCTGWNILVSQLFLIVKY